MHPTVIRTGKLVTVVFWLVVALAAADFLRPGWEVVALWLGSIVLAVHALEAVVFLSLWRREIRSLPLEIVGTLLFGFFHLQEMRNAAKGIR